MDKKTQDTYKTDDLSLTSFLLVNGLQLLNVERGQHNHFTFVLSNTATCQKLKNKYLNNALAPALDLFAKREMLISEIKQAS